tara:strand:- start:32 stop:217 length:186 start_codon:yes stop_codon:yes gene_type:complete
MTYQITQTELTCINILIRTLQEAINRKAFSGSEIENIYKTIEKLNSRSINIKYENLHQSLE